jgi:transcriptional regulator with XRE-family HTH domain
MMSREETKHMSREATIGRHLAALREQAGLRQNELAKRLEWSAAVLSRVEGGDRPLTDDELNIILNGIGTPEAEQLKEVLARRWHILQEPSLGDPDSDLLWTAEQTAQRIHALAEQPDVKQIFERRLVRYEGEIASAAQNVLNKRYRAAFIGTIAVGKSTAICRAEGLELPSAKGMPKAVLETGAGGITICEVYLRKGPGYGLIVEPSSEEEIRRHVADFANFLLNPAQPGDSDDDEGGPTAGISREVERALRNMTKLRRKRAERKPDGTVIPGIDHARELAVMVPDVKALTVELLARMEMHKRDRRDMWHSADLGKAPLEWLQEQFENVNNGRHDEFTLPKRIELVVPTPVLGDDSISVTLVDTQGIDDIAARADLEQHFDDTHTVVILCSVFNEAPATPVRSLLARAKEGGVRTLESHAAILVLPRPGEALNMKDNGYPAQSAEEGCDLKAEEVSLKLHPLGLTKLPLAFFNAADDAPDVLRSFIMSRISSVQNSHRYALKEIIEGANNLLANYEKEQAEETMREAARRLTVWLDKNAAISRSATTGRVHESLVAATDTAHWKTVYASVARRGEWPNLNYAHQLSHGARRVATQLIGPKLLAFKTIAENVLEDDDLGDAHGLARQTVRVLEDSFDAIVRTAQLVGESVQTDELSQDFDFWRSCSAVSGRGYRNKINQENRRWFEADHSGEAETRLAETVEQKWSEAIASVRELLPQ